MIRDLPISYRPDTQDTLAIREILFDNQYRLPDTFAVSDIILDVGAQIGCFALACKQRGNPQVWCCEPDAECFEHLQKNIGGKATLWPVAVWRSDTRIDQVEFRKHKHPAMTCMGSVANQGENDLEAGKKVGAVGLDRLIQMAAGDGPVRLCKIDAEGAEWPILWTSKRLGQIQELIVEMHFPPSQMIRDIAQELGMPYGADATDQRYMEATMKRIEPAGFDISQVGIRQVLGDPRGRYANWLFWAKQKDNDKIELPPAGDVTSCEMMFEPASA